MPTKHDTTEKKTRKVAYMRGTKGFLAATKENRIRRHRPRQFFEPARKRATM